MSTKAKQGGIELRKEMVRSGLWPCCLNCEHWVEVGEITDTQKTYHECGKYKMIPPDETIVIGCIQHLPTIPF